MSRFQIDQLSIHVSPASLLKCAIGLQLWYTRDVALQRPELAAFFEQVSRYVMQQPDDLPLPDLSAAVGAQLGKLRASHGSLPIADQFSQGVREILRSPQHRAAAERCAEEFAEWLGRFGQSRYHQLAARALGVLRQTGITLAGAGGFRDAYAVLAPANRASTGQYVPWLSAIAVELDAIRASARPELEFVETLLHEQIHAVIHSHMADAGEHYGRLPWFNELSAIGLSQYALARAAASMRGQLDPDEVPAALRESRANQPWGGLAAAALREVGDPLVLWRAWQAIFARGSYARRNYAHREVLPAVLAQAGWPVRFPYRFGAGQQVDCSDERVG